MNKADASDVFCAGLWDTSLEHHRAIGALLAHELPTSALVILAPLSKRATDLSGSARAHPSKR